MCRTACRRFAQQMAVDKKGTMHFEYVRDGVFYFTLNNAAKRNALSKELILNLEAAINRINSHNYIRAFVLNSSSPKAFCSGADLTERKGMSLEETNETVARLRQTFYSITRLNVPTFTLIDGACLGGGLELAISTDFRIATKTAVLGLPETSLAIIPGLTYQRRRNPAPPTPHRPILGQTHDPPQRKAQRRAGPQDWTGRLHRQ